jgi:hypothetical protein
MAIGNTEPSRDDISKLRNAKERSFEATYIVPRLGLDDDFLLTIQKTSLHG